MHPDGSAVFPQYDANGNMLQCSVGFQPATLSWNLSYNDENRLIIAESANQRLEFLYDYMGRRRIKKVFTGSTDNWTLVTEKRFVYKGFKQIAELDASDTIQRSYVWNGETPLTMTDSDGTFYYVTDNNKNVTMLIDSNDTVRATYEYSPFGKITNMTGDKADDNPIRFSSEYHDQETGLVYFNFRYYSPELGRWLSRDPIAEWGGVNLYGMVGNDPVNLWDYLGLGCRDLKDFYDGAHNGDWAFNHVDKIREAHEFMLNNI